MKIALLGYGKMGQLIAQLAEERGHEIVLKHTGENPLDDFKGAEVAIDFSTPESATKNMKIAFSHKVSVICGTTGWLDAFEEVCNSCMKEGVAFLYASNFSLGVNLFFALNKQLALLMEPHPYKTSIEEIHHTQKLDAPSGTAISLAEGVLQHSDYTQWSLAGNEPTENVTNDLLITSKREGSVPGTHFVRYDSDIDRIEISHTAHNRNGFALGAVVAAEWILNKKGVFSMSDVLAMKA